MREKQIGTTVLTLDGRGQRFSKFLPPTRDGSTAGIGGDWRRESTPMQGAATIAKSALDRVLERSRSFGIFYN